MPVYTGRMSTNFARNLVIELDLQVTGQSTASNQTNFKYTLKMKRRGKDNWNDNFHGDAKIWMNVGGKQILDGAEKYWSQRTIDHDGSPTSETLLKSGTFSVSHNADGTKKANVDVTVNPHTRNFSWGDAAIMRINESLTLTPISRKVSFTMSPSSTITLGNTLKVNVSGGTSTNYHSAYLYVDGESHVIGRRTGNGSISGRIPSDLVKSATAKRLSGSVRVFSYTSSTNLTSIGSPTRAITVSVPANAPIAPSVTSSVISASGVPSGFMGANQHVSGKSVLTASVQGAKAQSGASITLYEVRVVLTGTNTAIMSGTHTSPTVSLGTVPQVTPAAGQVVDVLTRVQDNRGLWSAEKKQASAMRFHRYSSPSGSGSTRREGTKAIVDVSWSVVSIKEGGSTEKNTAKVYIDSKARTSSSWTNKYTNKSAGFSGTYKATLTGYSETVSYDIRLRVVDSLGTTTILLNSLGTESVPFDASRNGIGIGTMHSGGGAHLQVGEMGIDSAGPIKIGGKDIGMGLTNQRNNESLKYWVGTKAQYDAIATKSSTTIYDIIK